MRTGFNLTGGRLGHAFRRRLVQAPGLVSLMLGLAACQSNVVGPDESELPSQAVRFSVDIGPLFAMHCAGCHVGGTTSGVNLTTYASVQSSIGDQYGELVVRPGNAAGSPLVDKIEPSPRIGARMPQGNPPLTADQIALVRAWIDAGALDN